MSLTLTLIGVITLIVILFFVYSPSGNSAITAIWSGLPTKEDYIKRYPQLFDDKGIGCCHCNSFNTLDVGLARFTDYRRTIICKSCKRQLWREEEGA